MQDISPDAVMDVIVIGAGASGLMCATECAKRGRRVLVLDHNARTGAKIRISGGGRCNFTNLSLSADNYLSGNPHFVKSALARFTPHDFAAFLRDHGLRHREKESGQLFCAGSAVELADLLQAECDRLGVDIMLECEIDGVDKAQGAGFAVHTNQGEFAARSLVVAAGGLSYPQLGASNLGYRIARDFGLPVTPLTPGLVPLVARAEERPWYAALSGVSVEAVVACREARFREGVLFTHKGLSGPAILQISSYWREGEAVLIDLLPDVDAFGELSRIEAARLEFHNWLAKRLPKRLALAWSERAGVKKPVARHSRKELRQLADALHGWAFVPEATEGFGTAEVTLGGVDTDAVSSKTMEAKNVPGLYFIGEVLDVTGQLGGYNLQWAWSSGVAAGLSA